MCIFIAWSGRGLIGLLIILASLSTPFFVIGLLGSALFPRIEPLILMEIGFHIGLLIAGCLAWWVGRRWNAKMPWEHTLYYFPVEYWGAFMLLLVTGLWIWRAVHFFS